MINGEIIFKALVGSHAYGTNVEGSDEDIKGVYIQDPKDVFVDGYKPQIEVSKDEVYFELGRFLELCGSSNPTVLELLFIDLEQVLYKHSFFDKIIEHRDKFLTKQARFSFAGYAWSQVKKAGGLEKKMNWEKDRKVRKDVLDFCYAVQGVGTLPIRTWLRLKGYEETHIGLSSCEHMRNCYFLFQGREKGYKSIADNDSNQVKLSQIHRDEESVGIMYFNLEAYQQHCREYNEYIKWLEARNTQRYVDIEGHGQKIDGKNLLHCVRLIDTAMDIALHKELRVRRDNASYLIEIRRGKHDLETILDSCKLKLENLDHAFDMSDLENKINHDWLHQFIKTLKEEWYDAN